MPSACCSYILSWLAGYITPGAPGGIGIREFILGDANVDGVVDRLDLNATTSHIMGEDPTGFYESQADLNGDDKVNAADVVKLVTILNIQDGLSMDWQTL